MLETQRAQHGHEAVTQLTLQQLRDLDGILAVRSGGLTLPVGCLGLC